MKRHFALPMICLLFPHLARALDMPFKQVSPDIYAYIGDTGLRTYENEGMNGNAGFIVTNAGVVVVEGLRHAQFAYRLRIRRLSDCRIQILAATCQSSHRSHRSLLVAY